MVKNQTVEGFSTIVQALVADSKDPNVLGNNKLEQALTKQWLEYIVLYLNYGDIPANSRKILKVSKVLFFLFLLSFFFFFSFLFLFFFTLFFLLFLFLLFFYTFSSIKIR